MSIHLHPYIFFTGDCREAMEFYRGIFGGKLEMQAFSEVPGEVPGKEEHPDWIMHASLTGGDADCGHESRPPAAEQGVANRQRRVLPGRDDHDDRDGEERGELDAHAGESREA